MSQTRHRIEPYECPRLKGTAQITIEDQYMKADEMPAPQFMGSHFKDCSHKMVCGIAERTGNNFVFRWNMCPKHPKFDPSTLP